MDAPTDVDGARAGARPTTLSALDLRALWRLACRHWPHLVLAPVALVGVTMVHEAAHAAVALAQGGELTDFQVNVLPVDGVWGSIRYRFPPGARYSADAISLAPYALWVGIMALVMLASRLRRSWPFWAASLVFVWGYVIAFGDLANAWVGWLHRGNNDFAHAFGPPGAGAELGLAAVALAVCALGYGVHRRLYGALALPPLTFAALSAAALFGLGCLVAL